MQLQYLQLVKTFNVCNFFTIFMKKCLNRTGKIYFWISSCNCTQKCRLITANCCIFYCFFEWKNTYLSIAFYTLFIILERYLKKLFIKKLGVSPIKYIIQLKINHACDLLHSKRCSITQVSELCGYDNVYYFSRQFKEYTGTSPAIFIERYKSSK